MTMSMKKQQQQQTELYGEYINPTIDQYSPKKENPLVLMAQACNNIGKELTSASNISISTKQRKSNSSPENKKSLKRTAPSASPPSLPPTKKLSLSLPSTITTSSSSSSSTSTSTTSSSANQQSFYFPPSPFMFDSLLLHQLSKTFSASPYFSTSSFGHSLNSAFSPSSSSPLSSSSSSQRSAYFMDSILSPFKPTPPAFVCNWMESTIPDGFCGKRFTNHMSLLEHLCTAHTSSLIKSSYPTSILSSYYSPTSVGKL